MLKTLRAGTWRPLEAPFTKYIYCFILRENASIFHVKGDDSVTVGKKKRRRSRESSDV